MSAQQAVALISAITALVVAVNGLWLAIRAHKRIDTLPPPSSPGGPPSSPPPPPR